MGRKFTWKQLLLYTALMANAMLVALIWAKHAVAIPPAADVRTIANKSMQTSTSYEFQLEHVTLQDGWRIEQYRQYEVTEGETGDAYWRKPTGEVQYVKYWTLRSLLSVFR